MESQNQPQHQTDDDWKNIAVNHSQEMSARIEESFHRSMKSSMLVMEKKSEENVIELLEMQLDYLFGTAVALAVQYITDGEEFEDNVTEIVRKKFEIIRAMKKERTNEPTQIDNGEGQRSG